MMLQRKLAGVLGFSVLAIIGSAQALPAISPKHKPAAKPHKHANQSPFPNSKPAPKKTAPKKTAPKKTGPKKTAPKPLPVPQQMQPIQRVTPQLDPKIAGALRNPKALSKTRIAGIAARFNIDATANNVEATTLLTVRRPHRGPGAYMGFEGARSVLPQTPTSGMATIDGGADLRRVRGTGPAIVPAQSADMLMQQYDPLHPDFPATAETTLKGPHLALHFQAAANRDYVVSCRVRASNPSAEYGVRVQENGAYSHMIPTLAHERGRVSFAIRRANKIRGIDLQLVAAVKFAAGDGLGLGAYAVGQRYMLPFSVSRCEITPLS